MKSRLKVIELCERVWKKAGDFCIWKKAGDFCICSEGLSQSSISIDHASQTISVQVDLNKYTLQLQLDSDQGNSVMKRVFTV